MLLRKISIYETPTHFYIVGCDISETRYHLLKIDRTEPGDLKLGEPEHLYSKEEIKELLATVSGSSIVLKADKRRSGAEKAKIIETVSDAFGIIGAVKFLTGFYLLVITKARAVSKIGYHQIFKIEEVETIYIPWGVQPNDNAEEQKYLRTFQSVDLTTDFYFSYTYDMSRTFQENALGCVVSDQKFIWNKYLLEPMRRNLVSERWLLNIVHGYVGHHYVTLPCAKLSLTLIGRRSAEYAGTRFLKRGANFKGDVANEVETEQIVWEVSSSPDLRHGKFSAFVQRRGSVPLIWSQDPANRGVVAKPPIQIDLHEPHAFTAAAHFRDLRRKYGCPIIVMNLVKRKANRGNELLLHTHFLRAINYLNLFVPVKERIGYLSFDVARCNKKGLVLPKLEEIGFRAVLSHGWFQSFPELYNRQDEPHPLMEEFVAEKSKDGRFLLQRGVSRTNCVDCLDRTNVAQFGIGKVALGCQLYSMGYVSEPIISPASELCRIYEELFDEHGDTMAYQYAGSQLVHSVKTYKKTAAFQERSRDVIQTISRYYSNTFGDFDKQHGINLFLGIYRPKINCLVPIWDMPTDHYLHFPIGFQSKADYCAWTLELDETANTDKEWTWNGRTYSVSAPNTAETKKEPERLDLFEMNYRCFQLTDLERLTREFAHPKNIVIRSVNQEVHSASPFMKLFNKSDKSHNVAPSSAFSRFKAFKKPTVEDDDDDDDEEGDATANDEEIEYEPAFLRITKPILANVKSALRETPSRTFASPLTIGLKNTVEAYGVHITGPPDYDKAKYSNYAKFAQRNTAKQEEVNDIVSMVSNEEMKPLALYTLDSTFQCEITEVATASMKVYQDAFNIYNSHVAPSARDKDAFELYRRVKVL
ncbi:hypothetical protein QR680_008138 [Steinernema hermaphroditum]|uniref:SAC domain-containing protein n=1 Tax=Steinernema hermaphroditum TaxID=289476 RepID=A0AA39M7B8_9BILA|nr:hypothetical protein QR680_008138 [Steinernema hermaphroditum]